MSLHVTSREITFIFPLLLLTYEFANDKERDDENDAARGNDVKAAGEPRLDLALEVDVIVIDDADAVHRRLSPNPLQIGQDRGCEYGGYHYPSACLGRREGKV